MQAYRPFAPIERKPIRKMLLQQVALSLQSTAIAKLKNAEEFDLFGRSAFNRYYYALYLISRSLVAEMDPGWAHISHSNLPSLIKGQIRNKIKTNARKSSKIFDNRSVTVCEQGSNSCTALSEILTTGYMTRVIADYEPGILVIHLGSDRFELNNTNITTAHNWSKLAKNYIKNIRRAWILFDEH